MADKAQLTETRPAADGAATIPTPPKRSPGHRGADVRDTVAEMAAKAQEISQEAGSKMAAAMKDVISAAAGLTGFAIESARDLVQFMVRRGQMTQEEADKLIREAEAADAKRNPHPVPPPSRVPKPPPPERTEMYAGSASAGYSRFGHVVPARPEPAVVAAPRPDKPHAAAVKRPSGARPSGAKKAAAAKPKKRPSGTKSKAAKGGAKKKSTAKR